MANTACVPHSTNARVDRVGQGDDTERMLIRPDGYACWAGADDVEPALARWFGEPA
ncbi:hypothetical protein [Streptomyces sp. YGL11-2]|uniref:aromatic-ring hydroxylase C-terminal domain-containing protein n=1 Tax=Streptomyces sp. YGL11-2 TaxID=3414028 RepID=UPI003CFB5E9B